MSTQKKSLVSSLKTSKKVKVAATPSIKAQKNTSLGAFGSRQMSLKKR
jgi:hypothetical protein